jgi:hypothetical protein
MVEIMDKTNGYIKKHTKFPLRAMQYSTLYMIFKTLPKTLVIQYVLVNNKVGLGHLAYNNWKSLEGEYITKNGILQQFR